MFKPSVPTDLECSRRVFAGLVAGGGQAILFHPVDRALFLAQTSNTPFFSRQNWPLNLKGIDVSLVQRSVAYGLYFPLEKIYSDNLAPFFGERSKVTLCISGQCAGATNGILTNTLSLLKFNKWNDANQNKSLNTLIREHVRKLGLFRTCTFGLHMTIARDGVFGGVFTSIRSIPEEKTAAVDFAAAFTATAISAPFNFVRNKMFRQITQTEDCKCLKTKPFRYLIKPVFEDIRREKGLYNKGRLIFNRFLLGYGTLRVAAGMTLGGYMYRRVEP